MNIEDIRKSASNNRHLLFEAQAVLNLIDKSFEIGDVMDMSMAAAVAKRVLKEVIDSLEDLETVNLDVPEEKAAWYRHFRS